MTFAGIDRKRFEYIVSLGTDDDERMRFFSDSRAQLILHGARVQNLPHGSSARIRTLSQLPPAAEKVLANWFRENVTMADPVPSAELVEEFTLYEQVEESPDESIAKRLARSCLVHLFAPTPPADLVAFLRTPIGAVADSDRKQDASPQQENQLALSDSAGGTEPPTSVDDELVADVVLALLESRDVERYLPEIPADLATFLQAAQVALRGDLDQARQIAKVLDPDAGLAARLLSFLDGLDRLRAESTSTRRGISAKPLMPFSGEFDFDSDAVVGVCTNSERANAVFIRPIAVIRAGQLTSLALTQAMQLFPESGDLMAFAGPTHPPQPRRGDIGVWGVAEHSTPGRSRFHIEADRRTLHEVERIPFPSGEPDSIRHYLMANANLLSGRIYELEDGLIIAPRPERPDLSKEETFDVGLRAWNTLDGFRLEGRLYVAGPLPQEHATFECGSLQSIARAILVGKQTGTGPLSKATTRELARAIAEEVSGASRQRLVRLIKSLDQLADNSELLDSLAQRALELPAVQLRIETAVSTEVAARLAKRDNMSNEIGRLKMEREQEEERLRKLREDQRRLKDETVKAVRGVFDRAKNVGIAEVLAQAALFGAVMSANGQVATEAPSERTAALPRWRITSPSSVVAAIDTFKKFGCSKQRATALSHIVQLSSRSGLMLGIRGELAGALLATLAETGGLGSKACIVDTTLGLVDDDAIVTLLETEDALNAVVLRDADLSPIEVYARPLIDRTYLYLAEPNAVSCVVCFNFSDSIAALPVPSQVLRMSLIADLGRPLRPLSEMEDAADLAARITPTSLEETLGLMPLAADRLSTELKAMGGDGLRLVCSMILPDASDSSPSGRQEALG